MSCRDFKIVLWVGWLCSLAVIAAGQTDTSGESREKAIAERFQVVLEKNPRRGTAFDRVYGYHVERGQVDVLITTYQDRLKRDPQDGVAWTILGLVESQRGNDANAVAAFRQAQDIRPNDPLPSFYLGQALILIGQPGEAEKAFENAIGRNPQRTDLLEIFQALGRLHQRAQRYDRALAVWTRLEQMLPDDLRVRERVATLLADEGQLTEALARYEALAKRTNDPNRKVQLKIETADLKVRLGKNPEALSDFDGILEHLNPDSWLFREVRHRIEGLYFRNDDQSGLATYYEARIKKVPDDLDAMEQLARLLSAQGKTEDARGWLERAVRLAPSRRELRRALIERLAQQGKTVEALEQYRQLAEIDHGRPETLRDWGLLLLKDEHRPEADRKAEAARVWRRIVDAKPDEPLTAVQVADLLGKAGLVDEAIALYQRAIELAPNAPQYREYLGEFLHGLKRNDEAVAAWKAMAAGPNRSAKSLRRLAEVLLTFGHLEPAIQAALEARQLAPDDLDVRLFCVDALRRGGRFAEASAELEAADRLCDTHDERDRVIEQQVIVYREAKTLDVEADRLQKLLEAEKAPTVVSWIRLARLLEADGRLKEAAAAARHAVALDDASVPAWATVAHVFELNGDLLGTAQAYRKLAAVDRRDKTRWLQEVARLETRLGHTEQALRAGREFLASAPASAESAEAFARLCFRLGQNEEGLETLRRSVRVHSADPTSLIALAEALTQQSHTDEAIEIYWRAFLKTNDLDAKLSILGHLTELYLVRNQFDGLIARLQRERGEPNQQRELATCLAHAYSLAGDYGSARNEVEKLVRENPRDTDLLRQLVNLAEAEEDFSNAARYQRLVNSLSPSTAGSQFAAQLHVQAGEITRAEEIWEGLTLDTAGFQASLKAIDSLIGHGQNEVALTLTEKLLRTRPNHWELLFRAGVALARQNRTADAEQRFQALLALRLSDDEAGSAARWVPGARDYTKAFNAYLGRQASLRNGTGVEARTSSYVISSIRIALDLPTNVRALTLDRSAWSPDDFGQARLATLGWLHALSLRKGRDEALLEGLRRAAAQSPDDPRKWTDLYYLERLQNDGPASFRAALSLAQSARTNPDAQWFYLDSLSRRIMSSRDYDPLQASCTGAQDTTPPLNQREIDQVLSAYQCLQQQKPEWLRPGLLLNINRELQRAGRVEDRKHLLQATIAAADDAPSLAAAIELAADNGDVPAFLALFDRAQGVANIEVYLLHGSSGGIASSLCRAMNACASNKSYAEILQLLDHYFASQRSQDATLRRQRRQGTYQARLSAMGTNSTSLETYWVWVGASLVLDRIDFPPASDEYDHNSILLLRNAFALLKRDGKTRDLIEHFRAATSGGTEAERLGANLALICLNWWQQDRAEAERQVDLALKMAPTHAELFLIKADLLERGGKVAEALKTLDTLEPPDQQIMQRRELAALRLAVRAGSVTRARLAAERLFGLRLVTNVQIQVADHMQQLGMHEQAEAILGRTQGRAGNDFATLSALMRQYARQNQAEAASKIAREILRKTPVIALGANYIFHDSQHLRQEAIQTLVRTGTLKEAIARLRSQLEVAPNSLSLLQSLLDYQVAAGAQGEAAQLADRIVRLRPRDAKLRYQVATQLAPSNPKVAVDHFRTALRDDPSLIRYDTELVLTTFQKSERLNEIAEFLLNSNLRQIGSPRLLLRLISAFPEEKNWQTLATRLRLRVWQSFAAERLDFLWSMKEEDFHNDLAMYDSLREAVLPSPLRPLASPWSRVYASSESSIGNDEFGRPISALSRLVATAEQNQQRDILPNQINECVKADPNWLGGIGFRAVLLARQGRFDEAKADFRRVLEERNLPAESWQCQILAREIDAFEPLREIAIKLYEKAVDDHNYAELPFAYSYLPIRGLARLYHLVGRDSESREILWSLFKKITLFSAIDHSAPWNYFPAIMIAAELQHLGFSADAARATSEIFSSPHGLWLADSYYWQTHLSTQPQDSEHTVSHQAKLVRQRAEDAWSQELASRSLVSWIATGNSTPDAVDLALLVETNKLDPIALRCLWLEMARLVPAEQRKEIRTQLERVQTKAPRDVSVGVASALLAVAWDDENTARQHVRSVLDLLANDRKSEAEKTVRLNELGLWVLAREMKRQGDPDALAAPLEAHALKAAENLSESRWLLAILRELMEEASKRDDRTAMERTWGRMLEIVLRGDQPGSRTAPSARLVVNPKQFEQATDLASLALHHKRPALALRAIAESIRGGPPLSPMPRIRSPQDSSSSLQTTDIVATCLFDLVSRLESAGATAEDIDSTIRAVVLPQARPGEIFLYPLLIEVEKNTRPRSVGALLVEWSLRAGKAETLKHEVDARRGRPISDVAADTLLIQLALAEGKPERASTLLAQLGERLRTRKSSTEAELACHALIPALALNRPETTANALSAARAAAESLARSPRAEPLATLSVWAARCQFANGRQNDEGRRWLQNVLDTLERSTANDPSSIRARGDAALEKRQQNYLRVIREYLRAGLAPDAFGVLTSFADSSPTRTNSPAVGDLLLALARLEANEPALARFERLNAWTIPAAGAESVRLLAGFAPGDQDRPPLSFGAIPARNTLTADPFDGVFSTAGWLIASARDAGKLDDLAEGLRPAAQQHEENAETLLLLLEIARGRTAKIEPQLRERLTALQNKIPKADASFPPAIAWTDLLLARACLASPGLTEIGQSMNRLLQDHAKITRDVITLAHLQHDAALQKSEKQPRMIQGDTGPWIPSSLATSHKQTTKSQTRWISGPDTIGHQAGSEDDLLVFAYPLTGTFEINLEASADPGAEGHLAFGGLVFEPMPPGPPQRLLQQLRFLPDPPPSWPRGVGRIWPLGRQDPLEKVIPSVRSEGFNTFRLQVEPTRLRASVNGQVLFDDPSPGTTYPWLTLYAGPGRTPIFRHISIQGQVEVPSQVALTQGNRLDGWSARQFNESLPPRLEAASSSTATYDWQAHDGEIIDRRSQPAATFSTAESRLEYARPLRNGETFSYEFFYAPDQTMVHPAIGRLAFLLDPSGLKLHWLSNGSWTGLDPENRVAEPAILRGPEPLPLRAGQWNTLAMTLQQGSLQLVLNCQKIAERALEPENDRRVGFFHDRDQTAARIRHATLSGPWPEQFDRAWLGDLTRTKKVAPSVEP